LSKQIDCRSEERKGCLCPSGCYQLPKSLPKFRSRLGALSECFCLGSLAVWDALRLEASTTRADWEVLCRHLVALKLAGLRETGRFCGPLELVLMAEQAIEGLVVDIDGGRKA